MAAPGATSLMFTDSTNTPALPTHLGVCDAVGSQQRGTHPLHELSLQICVKTEVESQSCCSC
ncbi:unnamed protein product [Ectocarpus sp. CCAP 1310/34]|nr:unnamed protein product [Ectocarpus sp. CCAP 1310/34]